MRHLNRIFLLLLMLWAGNLAAEEAYTAFGEVVEGDLIVQSWQLDHPFWTGALSGLTFTVWPGEYADDRKLTQGGISMNQGYGQDAFEYIKAFNLRIFALGQWVGFGFWGIAFNSSSLEVQMIEEILTLS